MADITLAEFNGAVWLVGGEAFMDDMLANTLASQVSIEFVSCEQASDVRALWIQNCGPQEGGGMPWQIHPNIVARIRRTSPEHSIFFTQWSVLLDAAAMAAVQAAAVAALQNPDAPVQLVEFLDEGAPASVAGLSHVRAQLIAERLVELGVAAERIERARRGLEGLPVISPESQRVDILVRPI